MPPSTISELQAAFRQEQEFGVPAKAPGKSKVTIFLLIGIALFLVVGASRMFMQPASPPTVRVVAAGSDIPAGCALGFTKLHYLTIPKAYLTADMSDSYDDLVGKTTKTFVATGEPILRRYLLPDGIGLAPNLSINRRAITLRLTDEALVDHSILPGDRVDVLVTSTAKDGKKYTKTVCQNQLVMLAAAKDSLLSDKLRTMEGNKVTLSTSPENCEKLTQAAEEGKIRLVLRNCADHESAALAGAEIRDLLPASALRQEAMASSLLPATAHPISLTSAPLPPPPPTPLERPLLEQPLQWIVQMFQGSKKEEHAFPTP